MGWKTGNNLTALRSTVSLGVEIFHKDVFMLTKNVKYVFI